MTEEEWLKCEDSSLVLHELTWRGAGSSERKRRLLTAAFADNEGRLHSNLKKAVLRFAEGNESGALIGQARVMHERLYRGILMRLRMGGIRDAGPLSVNRHKNNACKNRATLSILLREIFGNPFRPVTLDPKCLTPPVKQLAQAIYDDCTFDRLPILADLLQEAGCQQEDILKHLRGVGEHVRGCWVLDVVLGRA